MIRVILFALLLWGSTIFAIVRGGRSERSVAIIMLVATLLSMLSYSPVSGRFHHIELGVFSVDALTFAAFFAVALVSRKYWPLWVTGMQGVSLLSHLAPALPDVIPLAYANAITLWSWPMVATVAVATWLHVRNRKIERRAAGMTPA